MNSSPKVHVEVTRLFLLPEKTNGTTHYFGERPGALTDHHTIKGYYVEAPVRGKPFVVERYERNGVKAEGLFTTSEVQMVSWNDDGSAAIKTNNSIYRMKVLN